jgi:hypothetical protein
VGEFLLGGKGNRQHEMMMMGDDDEMINFLHSLQKGILRARGKHILLFCFAFIVRTLLCSLHTLLKKIQSGLEKMKP